jgi:hypothetical protein
VSRPRVMVVRGGGLSSRAIEGFGGGRWSHMANMLADGSFWDARDDIVTFQGVSFPRGVQYRPAGYLQAQAKEWAIFEMETDPDGYALWVQALKSQQGKPYDQAGILDFAAGLFTGRYADRNYAEKDPSNTKEWFCDEYAVWAAAKVGLIPQPPPELAIYTLTPGSALNLFIGAGWKMTGQQ